MEAEDLRLSAALRYSQGECWPVPAACWMQAVDRRIHNYVKFRVRSCNSDLRLSRRTVHIGLEATRR